jgi:hypothetical protein
MCSAELWECVELFPVPPVWKELMLRHRINFVHARYTDNTVILWTVYSLSNCNVQYWKNTKCRVQKALLKHHFSWKLWQTVDGRSTYQQNKDYQQPVHVVLYWAVLCYRNLTQHENNFIYRETLQPRTTVFILSGISLLLIPPLEYFVWVYPFSVWLMSVNAWNVFCVEHILLWNHMFWNLTRFSAQSFLQIISKHDASHPAYRNVQQNFFLHHF